MRQASRTRITLEAKDILPPKKAAEYLGVTTMTLWRWVRDGKIASIMLGHTFFHINELDRIKAARREWDNRSQRKNRKAAGVTAA